MYKQKINIQKLNITKDERFTEVEEWEDYYSPRADIITNMSGKAIFEAQSFGYERTITVYIRYCEKASVICPVKYRFEYKGQVYDIISADNVNHENKQIRLKGGLKL